MDEKRNHIKKIALKLFANEGYNSTSVGSIAHHVGISKKVLYNIFKSKDALLRELLSDGFEELKIIFIHNNSTITQTQKRDIKLLLKFYLKMIESNKKTIRLFYQINFKSDIYIKCSNEFKFIVKLLSPNIKSGNDKLLLIHLLLGITFNFIVERLTIDEIEDILDLYFE